MLTPPTIDATIISQFPPFCELYPPFDTISPGTDLLFEFTFGGSFMSLLILFVPQVLVFSLICTYCYRRTGSVYTGG